MRGNIDRRFARFRRTGDAAALAKLFDAAAPELLRVALYLSGDRHAAEDLVQGTFLVVIEDAASHDAERPVMPWLLGILANRARELRKARGRSVDTQRIAEHRAALQPSDPADDAARAEFAAAVTRAIAKIAVTVRRGPHAAPRTRALGQGDRRGASPARRHRAHAGRARHGVPACGIAGWLRDWSARDSGAGARARGGARGGVGEGREQADCGGGDHGRRGDHRRNLDHEAGAVGGWGDVVGGGRVDGVVRVLERGRCSFRYGGCRTSNRRVEVGR